MKRLEILTVFIEKHSLIIVFIFDRIYKKLPNNFLEVSVKKS